MKHKVFVLFCTVSLLPKVQRSSAPIFAIGGVKEEHIAEVQAAGAHGIALISALSAARDPSKAAKALLARLRVQDRAD